MNATITLFHGPAGWAFAILALIGAAGILTAIEDWLSDRFTLRLRRRWDRPGAPVVLDDGRTGYIVSIHVDDAAEGRMYVVLPADESAPEWVPACRVSPAPAVAEPVPAGDS